MNKDILEQMHKCRLNNHKITDILETLQKVNNCDEGLIKKQFNELLNGGYIIKDDKNRYHTIENYGWYKGRIIGHANGFAFCDVEDMEEDVFISSKNLHGAMHNDEVLVEIIGKGGNKPDGVVKQILTRGTKTAVGKLTLFKKFAYVEADNKKISKDIFVNIKKLKGAKNGDKVYVKINKYLDKKLEGEIIEVLGKQNTILSDVLSIVRSYDIIEEFPKEVLDASSKIKRTLTKAQLENRRDFRNDIIFTIDGDDSKDFDDAVSISFDKGIYTLGVHIADVGEYVKQDSVIDKEAFLRGTSVYFPNHTLPMLPLELSNDMCSLVPNEDRLTLSCIMQIDKKGEVIKYEICESVIKSVERTTYNNITKLLTTDDKELHERYQNILPSLRLMEKLCLILEERREKNGSLNFEIPEPKIIIDEKTHEVIELKKRPRTISERIIESFMVMANETVAKHYCKKQFPFVYRVHETPESTAVRKFEEFIKPLGLQIKYKGDRITNKDIQAFLNSISKTDYNEVVNKVLLRCMQKAKYLPDCLGHFGLGLEFYCHFTSPIRRYPDLTIHRFIKKDLKGKVNKDVLINMKDFAASSASQSSTKEVSAEKAERDVDAYYKARYMKKHIGEEYIGLISGVTGHGIYVELDNTAEGFIPVENLPGENYIFSEKQYKLSNNYKSFCLGDKVKIKVESANLNERRVIFAYLEK